jgi:deoxyribodipyrimidine photo-lyase
MQAREVPAIRVTAANEKPVRKDGGYVLYWMTAARRRGWNFALQRAVEWSLELGRPLVVLEALRCGYPWASDRLHAFVLEGMADNRDGFEGSAALYYPYVERSPGEGKGLLEALAAGACLAVTDEYPCFFLPRMVAAAAGRLPVRLEKVDGNGLLPLRATDGAFLTAHAFRRRLQKILPPHLMALPRPDPLAGVDLPVMKGLPGEVPQRWPPASLEELRALPATLASLPIGHSVAASPVRGGSRAASEALEDFLDVKLAKYAERRNEPSEEATSGLSPYLHFGHVSPHHVFAEVAEREGWSFSRISPRAAGGRTGWWGASPPAEAFLDQLVTWRELGFHHCFHREDHAEYDSLPPWARLTLGKHAQDRRDHLYALAQFEAAGTHDPLWNAAQRQLLREGKIHNYLRMLWGKKILEWTASPREALDVMVELNNRYALDGRDPNSYSGIFWTLGRYDRPWAPERPVFGRVRFMSSANTARKFHLQPYLERYGG